MVQAMISPTWFFGYDVVLEFIFAIVTLAVAILAFKIYKLTSQRQAKYLGIAFSLISISNIIQSLFNLLIITEANKQVCEMVKMQSIQLFNSAGIFVHITFMLIGLSILAFMTLKSSKMRGPALLSLISLIAVFSSKNPLYTFYLISSILLIFISWFFLKNFLKNKKTNTLLIAVAFLFMLVASVHFLLAVNHQLFYAIGHILELVAYILILTNFFRVLRR